MKILKYITILLMIISFGITAGGQVITVSGRVSDAGTGDPVPFYPVDVFANQGYLTTYFTDISGFFQDSLFDPGTSIDSLTFKVIDCELNSHDTTVTDLSGMVFVEFEICTDSTAQDCQADFLFTEQGPDPFTFLFQDLSVGEYDQWLWDFGDSTFSLEQNPVHTFPAEGTYQVCLAISSNNGNCSDMLCMIVVIDSSANCSADFTYQLDSLSNEPYRYQFLDLSTGNIDSWYWDFGDGHFSAEQSPVHVYQQEGTYQVCLYAARTSYPDSCFDLACQELTTANYYDLGGLVYIDDYPLNNPEHNFDTAFASLYRIIDGSPVQIGEKIFWEYGYYWFSQLLEGDYLVKVSLAPGSSHYDGYFPTYSGDNVFWESSRIITLRDSNTYSASINLVPESYMATGTGSIQGFVFLEDLDFMAGREYSGVTVILMDTEGNLLRAQTPDPSGYFNFMGLPLQGYKLKADATGRVSDIVLVSLDQSNQIISNVQLVVGGSGIFGVQDIQADIIDPVRVFPNPVRDFVNISIYCASPVSAAILITDITGRICHSETADLPAGSRTVGIPIAHLSSGTYLVRVHSNGNAALKTLKFIK